VQVVPLPAFSDNYVYALVDGAARRAAVVDPGDAGPVLALLERDGLALEAILLTHHHGDHVGGVEALRRRFPAARVAGAGGDRARLPALTEEVREGDRVALLGREAAVIEVPGHTRGHVAFFVAGTAGGGDLFSGDTVFGGTIGNLFEGTPDEMFDSLQKLRALPPATRIWCAHEYTLAYVREAARFDPGNARLVERLRALERRAASGDPVTVPLTLEEERATNPFFRWDDPDLLERLGAPAGRPAFRRLCELL
jgi:hydroxyacylglutathione hydrolase